MPRFVVVLYAAFRRGAGALESVHFICLMREREKDNYFYCERY